MCFNKAADLFVFKFIYFRFCDETSRYLMLEHEKSDPTKDRYERVLLAQKKAESDGLNSLKYNIISAKKTHQYFHLVVDV